MKIQCKCGQVEMQVDGDFDAAAGATTASDTVPGISKDATSPEDFKIVKNSLEISRNLKRVQDSFFCFCCRDLVLKFDGNDWFYNTKLQKQVSLADLDLRDLQVLKVSRQEKLAFQQQLDSKVAKEIQAKKDLCDKKIEELLDELEVYKTGVYDLAERVKESLVVDDAEKQNDETSSTSAANLTKIDLTEDAKNTINKDVVAPVKFTKGDEIFDFDEIDQDDLPSDLESEGNETPEEISEPTSNPYPTIFGSLPIQINVGSMRRDKAEDEKGFEPPHLFAARTFVETGIAMRPNSLSRRVSGL